LKESALEEQLLEANSALHHKFIELSMKCLWKITKILPTFLKTDTIRVDELLSDINNFLVDLPPQYWKRKVLESNDSQVDMPLRTVKTILHELVNGLEDNVLQFTYMFSHEPENHIMNYLNQMLLNVRRKKGLLQEKIDNIPRGQSDPDMLKLEQELDDIFNLVSDKDQTKLGIQRLYELRKQYPQIQSTLEQKLSTYGSYFQGYVRRSLSNLSQEDLKLNRKVEPSNAKGNFSVMDRC
jgi:cytoskeleton-associated protein 5